METLRDAAAQRSEQGGFNQSPASKKKTHWWSMHRHSNTSEEGGAQSSPPQQQQEDTAARAQAATQAPAQATTQITRVDEATSPKPFEDVESIDGVPEVFQSSSPAGAAASSPHIKVEEEGGEHNKGELPHALSETSIKSSVSKTPSGKWTTLRHMVQDPELLAAIKRELTINLDESGLERPTDDDLRSFKFLFNRHLHCSIGKSLPRASKRDFFITTVHCIRDHLLDTWQRTQTNYYRQDPKRIYYLSMEFFMGRILTSTMINLGLRKVCKRALYEMGLYVEELESLEADAGLGNGGLGRLAACFLDSMATMGLPAYGYGLRYEYGIFTQRIRNGWQEEVPDDWLALGNPWEIPRPEYQVEVRLYGHVVIKDGFRFSWEGGMVVNAIPYDVPVPGFRNCTCNTLRLWKAASAHKFDLSLFNHGDYVEAVMEQNMAESITRVLYPNDSLATGRELRLKQEYFLCSATLQDIIRRYKLLSCSLMGLKPYQNGRARTSFEEFPEKNAIQLNDTHPALSIPELMRLLMDVEGLGWDEAYSICQRTFAYTNHTVMPEALERWPAKLMEYVLPRHLQIIHEINRRHMEEVAARWPGDVERARKLSIIEEGDVKRINMARLCIVVCHTVNGVAKLHSDLIREVTFKEFAELWEDKFQNKTNGVTPRRWLFQCNRPLRNLINSRIGEGWVVDLMELEKLREFIDDPDTLHLINSCKMHNKAKLAQYLADTHHIKVNLQSIFDIQVKRIHEYKRQLLNVLHVITLFNRIKANPAGEFTNRTVIIGGKAAPAYHLAKLIIKLINSVADVINSDKDVFGRLKLVFIEDYRVSLAELIVPAADLSEQISTAGTEASGTSNMKFMMNGALTIGTLDGANVEIANQVGRENIFIFGKTIEEIRELETSGKYDPRAIYESNPELKQVLDQIAGGFFSPDEPGLFKEIVNSLLVAGDKYFLLADYEDYLRAQDAATEAYKDRVAWAKKALISIAMSGPFSSDRTIEEYNRDIWHSQPVIAPNCPLRRSVANFDDDCK